jgi:hypothetical protein
VSSWEWRRGRRLAAAPISRDRSCTIKGNISGNGARIYNMPGNKTELTLVFEGFLLTSGEGIDEDVV